MDKDWSMRDKKGWSLSSGDNQNSKQEEWTSIEQIQGESTLLTDNVFGIRFRVVPNGEGEYTISELCFDPSNIYYQSMAKHDPNNIQGAYTNIKNELEHSKWTATDLGMLMRTGVVRGIAGRLLQCELKAGISWYQESSDINRYDFLRNSDIRTMTEIEANEYCGEIIDESTSNSDIEGRKDLMLRLNESNDNPEQRRACSLTYQKCSQLLKQLSDRHGADKILRVVEENNLTSQDLALALSMYATKTGVQDAERSIVGMISKDPEERQWTPIQ